MSTLATDPIISSEIPARASGFSGRRSKRTAQQLADFHGIDLAILSADGYEEGFGFYDTLFRVRGSLSALEAFVADFERLI